MKATINFYLTWKCNFTCAHCVHECGPSGNHMTLEQVQYGFRFMNWLYQHRVPVCVIGTTGGEATLHPQFWTDYIPQLASFKTGVDHSILLELHTNASNPIGDEERIKYHKFFNTIFVGHDMCHRQFAPLDKLNLQHYTDITDMLHIRQNEYLIGGIHRSLYIRTKGRAAESLANGRLAQIPVQEHPKMGCSWYDGKRGIDSLNFTFTPDHINHCGEKSHPLPPLPNNQGRIDEGQFHPYTMDFDKLFHAALDYGTKYSGPNCSQKCMLSFCTASPVSLKDK
jgi:hypothetical protein